MPEQLLKKLQDIVENPGLYRGLTAEEQAELFLILFTPKSKVLKKPKVIKGIDGYTPVKDKDYLARETAEKLIAELSNKSKAELEQLVSAKLASIKNGRDGKDAVITPELVATIAEMAQAMIVLPDFPTLITMEPEAIRNSLELLPDGEKLAPSAIEGLTEKLQSLENRPVQQAGGVSKNTVLKLIEENASALPAGGTTGQVLAKASDTDGDAEWVSPTAGAASWGDITGTLSDQTDLQTALNAKANTSHTHAISDVTNLQTALDGKAAVLGADDNYVTDAEKVKLANLSGTNTGDQTSIVGITGTKAQFDTAVTDGNFMYVGDAPTAHTHVIADTTGLQTALDGKASTTHTHVISDVTGLQTALDGKAPSLGVDDNYVTDAEKVKLANLSGTNSGDQTSIVGITGTKAQFNTAVTDGDILYTDAIGATVQAYSAVLAATTASFTTADETKLDGIAAGAEVNVNADWNAVSGDAQILNKPTISGTNTGDQTTIVGITGTKAQFDTAVTDGNFLYVGDVTTNATHTGEVTGSGALTVDKTAITNKTLVTAAVGDHILIADASDTENLKKVTVQTIIDLAGGGSVSDAVYDASWNGDTTTAPSKNAVYDKIETLSGGSGLTQSQVLARLSIRI